MFNFLENLCEYYKYDKEKIEKFLGMNEWVHVHAMWWVSSETEEGYSKEFRDLVNDYLKDTKAKNEISFNAPTQTPR